jgi:predicted DsbA family dithiol-disulfide isomerase
VLAEELGLDVKRFSQDLKSPQTQAALEQNFASRRGIGVYISQAEKGTGLKL